LLYDGVMNTPVHVSTRTAVGNAIERMRPLLQSDGGDIELVHVDDRRVLVRLTGACAECPTSHMTLYAGVERVLRRLDPSFSVELVP
jgi:Fe-S cluster biogenesis protein NfuA